MKFWPKKWGVDGYFECRTLTPDVADFLIGAKVKLVGVDAMSVDCLEDKSRPVHMKLLKEEIIAVECLINLDKIPTRQFEFMALPLPLRNAAGSPTRAVALL
jgi:kynurenine formamidase